MDEISNSALFSLEGCYETPRPKALLALAKESNLLNGTVQTPAGNHISAPEYCMMLYCNATEIEKACDLFKQFFQKQADSPAFQEMVKEAYQIVCLLLTIERASPSCWNFGSESRYMAAAAGIQLNRLEMNTFLAQQGSFASKAYAPSKSGLMANNPLAVAIYAAELFTLCNSGKVYNRVDVPQQLRDKVNSCIRTEGNEKEKETLEALMDTFCPAFLEERIGSMESMRIYLSSSDFYTAPASTKYHGNFVGGLANHNIQVFLRLMDIYKPQTEKEVGMLILLTVAHDLCKIGVYHEYFTNEKMDGPALRMDREGTVFVDEYNTKHWSNGMTYHYQERMKYRFDDDRPQGHGQKSLNMILGWLPGSITEEMAAAIDGHMRDAETNPYCDRQMEQYPLCQYLHIADVMASMLYEETI